MPRWSRADQAGWLAASAARNPASQQPAIAPIFLAPTHRTTRALTLHISNTRISSCDARHGQTSWTIIPKRYSVQTYQKSNHGKGKGPWRNKTWTNTGATYLNPIPPADAIAAVAAGISGMARSWTVPHHHLYSSALSGVVRRRTVQ